MFVINSKIKKYNTSKYFGQKIYLGLLYFIGRKISDMEKWKKQTMVSRLSAESEFRSMALAQDHLRISKRKVKTTYTVML